MHNNRLIDDSKKPPMRMFRDEYIKTCEKRGVDFKSKRAYWTPKKVVLERIAERLNNKEVCYPKYFIDDIHMYENGNLSWEHAFDTKCYMEMTALVSLRYIAYKMDNGNEEMAKNILINEYTPNEAYEIYKRHLIWNICHNLRKDGSELERIADFGCGTGEFTSMLGSCLRGTKIVGVDLSPMYLSIAEYKNSESNVKYKHDNIEDVVLEEKQDVIVICYVFHEMPVDSIRNTIRNAYKQLKKGGQLIVVDINPYIFDKYQKHMVIYDISEPYLRGYMDVKIKELLDEIGFEEISEKHLHMKSYLSTGLK